MTGKKYNRPPVVEAWIGFTFALTQETSVWNEDVAKLLVKTHFSEFVPESFSTYAQIRIDAKTGKPDFTHAQELFGGIRAFSVDREKCIQAGRNVFVFNQLNKERWLGYPTMRDRAIEAASRYMELRGFDELEGLSLHYRDVVSIPKPSDKGIHLVDWFAVYPEVPEQALGTMSAFRFDVQLSELCKRADTRLSIRSLPPINQDDPAFKFSIDWHISSTDKVERMDVAKDWLDPAHDALQNSFSRAFKPDCLKLFEPVEGE